jgi:hypothetical protein
MRSSLWRIWCATWVSVYLSVVLVILVATRRVRLPWPELRKALRAALRRPYVADLGAVENETGFAYWAPLPPELLSDADLGSRLSVLEDGTPLPHAHAVHLEIRERGAGRYSHWGSGVLFSTTDNSDPKTNGRRYSVREA